MENEDADALNNALNTPTDDSDAYPAEDEPETEAAPAEEAEPAEEEADEAEAETKPEDDAHIDEPDKPVTRAQLRIQNLANEKKLAEQRAQLLEQQLETERIQRMQQQQYQQRSAEEEELTPLERWQRQADSTIRQVQFQNADMADKSEFLFQVSKNTAEAAYIERVERTLAEARRNGFNPRREDVLIRLMGMDARKAALDGAAKAPAVKREAAQRVTAAKGKPVPTKSNVAAQRSESTEFDRLKDLIL
jgi:hypothetical protein